MVQRAIVERNAVPFYVSEDDAPAKRKIMIAALELFVRNGVCETSIRDIAKVSGFTNPAMFKHFTGKDKLAEYLFERCYLELFRIVQESANRRGTFAEKNRWVLEAYLAALDREPNSVLFVQEWLRHFWPRMRPEVRRNSILGEVKSMIVAGRKEGSVTKEIDLNLLAAAWVGTLQQFARARYFGEFRQNSREIVDSLEKLLTRLVGK